MELKSLTYTSWARPTLGPEDVEAILRSAQINNPLDGITGIMIFNGTAFMQVLEGSETGVRDLFQRLVNDQRHSNITIRREQMIAARSFPDWSMAYLRLEDRTFVGKKAVQRALLRDLPQPILNLMMGMSYAVGQVERPL